MTGRQNGPLQAIQNLANESVAVQRHLKLQELANAKTAPVQREIFDEEEKEPGQFKIRDSGEIVQAKPQPSGEDRGGLPSQLKAGIENLSGISMDGVKVHRNSSAPAKVGAHAYAQGRDIHLGPGQEKHLPHEAWHVVQQAQGRVKPTTQLKAGIAINDDAGLEREADVMGAKAVQFPNTRPTIIVQTKTAENIQLLQSTMSFPNTVQCYGAIRFANLKNEQKYQTKGAEIVATLQATPSIQGFLANKNTLITLEHDPQLASVNVNDDQVRITLSPWFFEQQSRGRIVGMLAHEFGVHPLADEALTAGEQQQETQDIANDTAFATGLPGHTITPGAAGQTDHIFAAVEAQPRFNSYRQTAYEMANAMFVRTQANAANVTEAHVTDQIMTFLSDIAMILATNDHRGRIVAEPQRTADAFNHVRTRWFAYLNGRPNAADLTRLTPGVKTKGSVLGEVASLAGRFILSIGTGSKDNSQLEQTKTGIINPTYADLSNVQQGVLGDYGLNLQPKNTGAPTPSFLNVLDDATGNAGGYIRMDLLNEIGQQLPHNVPAINVALNQLQQDLMNNTLGRPISSDDLHYISALLVRKIRVIKPNGKIEVKGNGNLLTLLEVIKPALHYRFGA